MKFRLIANGKKCRYELESGVANNIHNVFFSFETASLLHEPDWLLLKTETSDILTDDMGWAAFPRLVFPRWEAASSASTRNRTGEFCVAGDALTANAYSFGTPAALKIPRIRDEKFVVWRWENGGMRIRGQCFRRYESRKPTWPLTNLTTEPLCAQEITQQIHPVTRTQHTPISENLGQARHVDNAIAHTAARWRCFWFWSSHTLCVPNLREIGMKFDYGGSREIIS